MKTIKTTLDQIPCPELRGSINSIIYPALVELKVDGEFCFVHISKGESFTVNKYGKVRMDFNALNQIESDVTSRGFQSATFLAELFYGDGKNGALYHLLSNKESDDLNLYVFDLLQLDLIDLKKEQLIDRRETMLDICAKHTPTVKIVQNRDEALNYFKIATDKGFEGVVVKSLTGKLVLAACDWVKLKSKDRNDLKVLTVDPIQERIEVVFHSPNPVIVGVKCAQRYKKYMTIGMLVTIEHQGVLASGSLRHPVLIARKEWK